MKELEMIEIPKAWIDRLEDYVEHALGAMNSQDKTRMCIQVPALIGYLESIIEMKEKLK